VTEIDYEKVAQAVLKHIDSGTFARPLYTVNTLAERLDVSPRQVRKMIAGPNPKIESFLIDGSRRIDPRVVDRYIEEQKAKAA
jgi:transcriptional antiterminator